MRCLYVVEGTSLPPEIAEKAHAARVPVREATDEDLQALSGMTAHQGIVAEAEGLPRPDFVEAVTTAHFFIALDGVTDPRNMGAVARAAEGAGATGLIVQDRRSAPFTAAAQKAAAGAMEYLPIFVVSNLANALELAKKAGMWVVGLAPEGKALWECGLCDERVILVAGSEGKGIRPRVQSVCDELCGIPLYGRVASLNVATAVAVAAFHVAERQERQEGKRA